LLSKDMLNSTLIYEYSPTAVTFTPLYYEVWALQSRFSSICPKRFWSNTKNEGLGRCEYRKFL